MKTSDFNTSRKEHKYELMLNASRNRHKKVTTQVEPIVQNTSRKDIFTQVRKTQVEHIFRTQVVNNTSRNQNLTQVRS